jgi:hemerythrin superfamily protein
MSIQTTKQAHDRHCAVRDHVEHFLVDARALSHLDLAARIDVIERTTAFLAEMLLPHAAAEERVLYPEAAQLLGGADGSDSVAADRAAVRELLARLALADPEDEGAIQEVLYALYALLTAHLWREEEVLVNLATARDEAGVDRLIDHMSAAEPRAGRFGRRGTAVGGA